MDGDSSPGARAHVLSGVNDAAAKGDFEEAAALLRPLLDLGNPGPPLYLRYSRLLRRSGQLTACYEALEEALQRFPTSRAVSVERLARRVELLRAERAPIADRRATASEIRSLPFDPRDPVHELRLVGVALALPDLSEARARIQRVLPSLNDPADLRRALRYIAALIERNEQEALLDQLLRRARSIPAETPGQTEIELAVCFALRRRSEFLERFNQLSSEERKSHPALSIIARRWQTPMDQLLAEPRIFGIGLPKTATSSLAAAFTRLGYFNADHHSPVSEGYVTLADAVYYDAMTDCEASHAFESAYYLFPNTKFILTHRPVDSWISSLMDHNMRFNGLGSFNCMRAGFGAPTGQVRHGTPWLQTQFLTLLNAPDPATAWQRHIDRVTHFFADKPGKLLHFNVFEGDGWRELCAFLDVPTPTEPFPHKNAARAAPSVNP